MQQQSSLKEVLSKVGPDSCPYKFNFHCHTTCSDGSMTPIDLISQATKLNLEHIAVTDHHSTLSYNLMKEWLFEKSELGKEIPFLWTGVEITCLLKKCLIHTLALGIDINSNIIKKYTLGESATGDALNAKNVVNSIHDAGGMAFLAHPARYRIPFSDLLEESKIVNFDGAEVWYDYNHSSIWSPTPFICEKINNKVRQLNMYATCGTDTHGYDLLGR